MIVKVGFVAALALRELLHVEEGEGCIALLRCRGEWIACWAADLG